jgi:acyl-CoA synthetase (AMP-forming)/AMP-acid ligase II
VKNLIHILLQHAENQPQKIALIDANGEEISFENLLAEVQNRAQFLKEKGIQKGDAILVFVPMSIELYAWILGIWYAGATAVFVDAWAKTERLEQCCIIAKPRAFLGTPKAHLLRILSKEIRKIPLKIISGFASLQTNTEFLKPVEVEENDTALITFTTGSTGIPKAAKRTHEFLLQQHLVLKKYIAQPENSVDLPALPVFVLHNLASGITSVLPDADPRSPEKAEPEKLLKQIEKHRITSSVASPVLFLKLAEYLLKSGEKTSLKEIHTGGAPVFPKQAKLLLKAFPQTKITIVYGSTEAEPISMIPAEKLASWQQNISETGLPAGKPIDNIALKIIRISDDAIAVNSQEEFLKMCLKTGEVGEICVSGKHVLKEYVANPEAIRQNKIYVENEVWHRTGDAGYLDENGDLFLMGRVKQRFPFKNKMYFAFPLEAQLAQIDGVTIGTVFKKGEEVFTIIEVEKSSQENVLKALDEMNFPFKTVKFVQKIPRDPRHNSKIDYGKLGEIF